jgi:hypothetical protein
MSDERIKKALDDAGITERISCHEAFAIAEKAGISPGELGKYCTKNRIKIHGCQLGCFT